MPNDAMNFGVDLLPITDATYNLGDSDHKWNIFGDVTGTAASVTTTADTSSTLYLIGVTSSATDTLKRDTSLTMKGGRLTAATGLTVSNSSGADRHLEFSRSTYNYISIPSGSELCIFGAASSSSSCTTTASIRIGVTASSNNVTAGFITPGVTNKMNLGASNLRWSNIYANTLWGTAKHASAAHWSTTAGSPSGVIKVKINKKEKWMLTFTMRLYQNYKYQDIVISGYNYGTSNWYSVNAYMLGSSETSSVTVSFGYDNDAASNGCKTLWVSVPVERYTGIDIFNVTNGFTQIDIHDAFEIVQESTSTGTVQTTVECIRPWLRDETVSSATSSLALANSKGTYGTAVNISSGTTDRYTNANIDHVTNGGVVHFKSTSVMSGDNSNKPMGDGNILHFHWDTADGWDSQLYIPDSGSWHMQWRGHTNKTTWQTGWNTLLDDKNYQEYAGIEIIRLAT